MTTKIITILLNYLMSYVFIPISMVVIDYFQMKKKIKKQDAEILELKNAKTLLEKINAANNMS